MRISDWSSDVCSSDLFSKETVLDMSQMDVPTKADITRRIKEIEKAAKEELEGLKARAQEAMQNPQAQEVDPAQAQQAFQQGQQQILAKYAPMLKEAESQVPIEDVMKLLRDDKGRNFTFEIESSRTILTDRKSDGKGKSVSVRVELGGRRTIKKKTENIDQSGGIHKKVKRLHMKPTNMMRRYAQLANGFK